MTDGGSVNGEPAASPRPVAAIESLVDRYALFLFDQYGVLHDGVRPYDGVAETRTTSVEAIARPVRCAR